MTDDLDAGKIGGMSIAPRSDHPPIYGQLVRELGDVVSDTQKLAEKTEAQAREALNFSAVHRALTEREDTED